MNSRLVPELCSCLKEGYSAKREVPAGVEVFEIYGPFFFGAANQFKDTMGIVKKPPKVLVLRMRHVLSGVRPQLASYLNQNGFKMKLAGASICPDIDTALAEARRLLAPA